MKSYRYQFPSVGPSIIRDLELINIHSREELIKIGSLGAMQKLLLINGGWQKYKNCSCQTYAFEGIIRNCKWYDIPNDTKEMLKKGTHELKNTGLVIKKD